MARKPIPKKILTVPLALSRLVISSAPIAKMKAARMRLMMMAWVNDGLIQSSMCFSFLCSVVECIVLVRFCQIKCVLSIREND